MLRIFALYDDKAKAFMPPFCMPEVGLAIRAFGDLVSDSKHPVGAHPGDYAIYHLGTFDEQSGVITALSVPSVLMNGLEMRAYLAREASDEVLRSNMAKPGSVPANGEVHA